MSSTPDDRDDFLQKVVEVMSDEVYRRFTKCGGIGDFTFDSKKSVEDSRKVPDDESLKKSLNDSRDDLLQRVVEAMSEEVLRRFKNCGGIGDFTLVSKKMDDHTQYVPLNNSVETSSDMKKETKKANKLTNRMSRTLRKFFTKRQK